MSFILDALKKLELEKKKKEVDISVMEQLVTDDKMEMDNSIFNKKITLKFNTLLLSGGILGISILLISIILNNNNNTLKTDGNYANSGIGNASAPSSAGYANEKKSEKFQEKNENQKDFYKTTPLTSKIASPPLTEVKESLPELKISAIFYKNNGRSKAIVSGNTVYEGDKIDGVEVLKIEPESIRFKFKEREFTVRF
ncbi:MAG: general secretion pathway protein GspB [Thermodesulfobacteriota bacterium]|nr:general secretion pathway protein GspB [Thermodesulfobacteriota bacterium]